MNDWRAVRPMGRSITGEVGSTGLDQSAIRMVASHAPGSMEHGHGPIRIGVASHRDRHIVEPVWGLRDLQARAVIVPGIVVGDDAFVLHTENLGEGRADPRDEGRPDFGGRHRTVRVVGWEKLLGEIPVRRRQLGDPGQRTLWAIGPVGCGRRVPTGPARPVNRPEAA